MILRI
jgi:hypothetical protein